MMYRTLFWSWLRRTCQIFGLNIFQKVMIRNTIDNEKCHLFQLWEMHSRFRQVNLYTRKCHTLNNQKPSTAIDSLWFGEFICYLLKCWSYIIHARSINDFCSLPFYVESVLTENKYDEFHEIALHTVLKHALWIQPFGGFPWCTGQAYMSRYSLCLSTVY